MKKKIFLCFIVFASLRPDDETLIKNIHNDNFETEILQATSPVFFNISVAWCSPCKHFEPIFQYLSTEFKDRAIFATCYVDVALNQDLLQKLFQKYLILLAGFPVLLVFNQGKYIKIMYMRNESQEDCMKKVNDILEEIEKVSNHKN